MRLYASQTLSVSSTPAEEKDLGNAQVASTIDALNEGGVMRFRVPAGALNQNVQHSQVATAAYLFLRSEARDPSQSPVEITLKRNTTSGEPWPLTPVDGKQGFLQMSTSGLTALFVSNPGSNDMDLVVGMGGD